MIPSTVAEDSFRAEYLEALYLLDRRDKKDHPLHGVYSGLYQKRQRELRLRVDQIDYETVSLALILQGRA